MRNVFVCPPARLGYDYPPDHVFVQWKDVGFYAMGSGRVTGSKVHPVTGEVWVQKIEFYSLRYEVYESVDKYIEAVRQYRATVERDPERS